MAAIDVRMAELERRVAEVENRLSSFDELARATSEFGTAVESRLNALAAISERLDHKLSDLRVAQKHEYDLLRERFVVAERAHAATDAALTRRLSEAPRGIEDLKFRLAGCEAAIARENAYLSRKLADAEQKPHQ